MDQIDLELSTLNKTWIIDIDGTILKHNGYITDGSDTILRPSINFLNTIPENDYIILLTARSENYKKQTISFLKRNKIRFNKILFNIPTGERILINDSKPSGLKTAYAVNIERDNGICIKYHENQNL